MAYAHNASIDPDEESRSGLPTNIRLGGIVSLSLFGGGIPMPEGWREVVAVEVGSLLLTGDWETAVTYPYDLGSIEI